MTSVLALTTNPSYFPQLSPVQNEPISHIGSEGIETSAVEQAVRRILGSDFVLQRTNDFAPTGLAVYDTLGQVLPFSPQTAFFWKVVAYPFASMIETAAFSTLAQLKLLIFVYARVLGFMGPEDQAQSVMAVDGSSTELSWVIPNKPNQEGGVNRQVRFAIEPLHPETGEPLSGPEVLDYFASEQGGLSIVKSDEESLKWRKSVESWLFSDFKQGIPENSRFFVGFDFRPDGTLTLKAYYLLATRPSSPASSQSELPIYFQDEDFSPLRSLVPQLHASLSKPLNTMLNYFDELEDKHKAQITMLAVDCIPENKNRLKIYFHTKEGTSFSHVKQFFALGNRQSTPYTSEALDSLATLWGKLFPTAASFDRELATAFHGSAHEEKKVQHPIGGLLYYYELVPGQEAVFPKVYLQVRNYCTNDLQIAQALEEYYEAMGIRGPQGEGTPKGWYAREVGRAYKHRPLDAHSGIHTYVTFALKKLGWDLTSYFSPETWIWLQSGKGSNM